MEIIPPTPKPIKTTARPVGVPAPVPVPVPFGVNEMRLNARQWVATLLIVGLALLLVPKLWERIERFDTGPDYRIPYSLSKDYWLYGRRMGQVIGHNQTIVLGDSVVWGEYVAPDGTLSHFLNKEAGTTNRFVNMGINGMFPLAQEGLVDYYGKALRNQKVILQCNVLWMTSPKADLSTDKEDAFNHSSLVPQFTPRIPCYKADASERLSVVVQREVGFLQWVGHLQNAYFDQKNIAAWTLEEDGASSPPTHPNSYKNPLAQITMVVPSAPLDDPQRGPKSPRHKPWSTDGKGTTRFEWVGLDASLQWHAVQRTVNRLNARGNDVLVVLGPFNEHLMAEDNRQEFHKIRDGILLWLNENKIPTIVPETLPSELYADASHPLTAGYELLAKRIYADPRFQSWQK
jgi:hypothetical protein